MKCTAETINTLRDQIDYVQKYAREWVELDPRVVADIADDLEGILGGSVPVLTRLEIEDVRSFLREANGSGHLRSAMEKLLAVPLADPAKPRRGTCVRWTSGARGSATEKTGIVVRVLAPGERPKGGEIREPGLARDHESYLVRVGNRLYWPRVKGLEVTELPDARRAPMEGETAPSDGCAEAGHA